MGATYLFESVDVRPEHPARGCAFAGSGDGPNSGHEAAHGNEETR